ncbi:MAG: T9SS type A sorting domain-containing protein [Saprospiraceae bacterium]|nr:T9SS type A sorting domain-containing protein [Saprospiraceae bacterium]
MQIGINWLDTAGFSAGMYFLLVKKGGKIAVRKVVKI